jgi:aminoglycoside 6'-N-acetyltransferase I
MKDMQLCYIKEREKIMIIRQCISSDLKECTDLFINVFNKEPWNDNWTQEYAEQYLNDYVSTPGFFGVIAEERSKIKGFIFGIRKKWWSGDEYFINEMCVAIETQRSGIGTCLLNYLENKLQDEQINRITLLTNKGIPAEGFYKKNGFTEIDRLIFLSKKSM